MKNKITIFSFGWSLAAGLFLLAAAVPVTTVAQETTSSIRGNISAPDGSPAANSTVTVTDTRTLRSRTLTTSDTGIFSISGLSVGGPYSIAVSNPNYGDQRVTDVFLALGETYSFDMTLTAQSMEEIVVTAAAIQSVQVAVGPSTTFNLADLEQLPSINRDIRDIIRVDPRVYIDEAFVDGVQCVGANPRFNSITVDGVKLNDNFGLNSNGYPTQRMPFPYDAIQNVSVELAPYSVQYGGFTACNTNAVTKSGTNEFSGSVWLDYTDDSFVGDKLEGDNLPTGDFDEMRYGFSIGGPIIKDKLFFFAAYEMAETADTFDRCAGDQTCGRPIAGVTQAQVDRIAQIARNLYEYEPGEPLLSSPVEDEKYLLKLDWNINDDHRSSLTYNYNNGFNLAQSDGGSDEYEFSNHFYRRGAELEAYSGQLFSDWNDNFSTELRFGYSTLDNTQVTRNGVGFGEVQIRTYDASGQDALVYLGGDDSRQSNKLDYETTNFKAVGSYVLGDHVISGGFEQESIDIFNLFVQHTIGEYRFDEQCSAANPDGCIDAFENFSPDDIYYGNSSGSLDPSDSAAQFGYAVNTLYLQDEFTFADYNLTLVAGVRYDWYTSDDLPAENANFIARSGFSNRNNFDGESLLQPRFGFSWDVSDVLSLRGGFGLYSGGNPNVWLGNNYQNDGFTQVQAREFNAGDLDELNIDPTRSLATEPLGLDGNGRPIYDAPQALLDFVANGTADSSVNAVDPNFDPPSNWKLSLGGTYTFDLPNNFGTDYVLSGDVIVSRGQDSAILVDDTLVSVGQGPDGRPIYFPVDKSVPGCATDPLADAAACARLFTGDYILTNAQDDIEQLSLAFSLSKSYDWGLDWTFGYAYTESEDVNPMTSSVAFSNYFNVSVSDPNNPGRATSNYEIPHRAILRVNYEKEFFGDNTTRFTLFGSRNEGRPFSYSFIDQEMFIVGPFFNPSDSRSLLYMPSGPSDPNVIFDAGFDQAAFFAFADAKGISKYGGGIVPRNAFNSSWWTKFDLKISQELPGFGDQKAQAFLIIENFGNLLNDDWGVLYEQSFPRSQSIVEATLVDTNGTPNDFSDDQYLFQNFQPGQESRVASASLWAIRIGFNYRF